MRAAPSRDAAGAAQQKCPAAADNRIRAPQSQPSQAVALPTFTVKGWQGRMGNHFVQIHNAVSLAVCCRGVVRLPESIHDEWPHLARQLDVSAVLAPAVEVASAAACNSSAFEAEDAWSLYAYASHLPQRTRDALHSCTYDEHALMLSVTLDEAPNCAAACARLHPKRTRADCKVKWRMLRAKEGGGGEEEEEEDAADEGGSASEDDAPAPAEEAAPMAE